MKKKTREILGKSAGFPYARGWEMKKGCHFNRHPFVRYCNNDELKEIISKNRNTNGKND